MTPPTLLERQAEQRALRAGLASARDGTGRTVVIEGVGGIGKSRLVAGVRADAADVGLRSLTARCSEFERSFAFGAVRQALEPLLRTLDPDRRRRAFEGAAALAAPVLEGAPTTAVRADPELFARLHGLLWLVANLAAEEPLVLCVDDAHQADDASLRFLEFLARRIGELPVLLVVASRPLDDPATHPAVAPVLIDPEAILLRPAPLTADGAGALLAERAGHEPDEAFVAACVHATGGNPFLLRELVAEIEGRGLVPDAAAARSVPSLGPAGVARTILLRIRRLGPTCERLTHALAILGDGSDLRLTGTFAGLEDAATTEAARRLEAADVSTGHDGRLRFVHPIVREAVYRGLTAVERGERHDAAARLLASSGASPESVAAHLIHAPPRGSGATVDTLRAAARHAEALGDPRTAAAHLARGLREPPASEDLLRVRYEYGRAAAHAGDARAVPALEACLTPDADPEVVAGATEVLAELRTFSGLPDHAVDVLERGLAVLGEDTREGRRLEGLLVSAAHITVPVRARLLPRLRRFQDHGGPARDADDLRAFAALASDAIMDHNDGPRAVDVGLRALAAVGSGTLDPPTRGCWFVLSVALMGTEEFAAAERVLERLLDDATALGAPARAQTVRSLRGLVRYRAGRVPAAETDALAGLELLPEAHGAEMMAHAGTAAAVLAGIELERPRAALERLLDETGYARDKDILPFSTILLARGGLMLEHGEHEAALESFTACDRDAPGWGGGTPSLVPWRSGAVACLVALDRFDEARAVAEDDLRLARASGLPGPLAVAEHALATTGGGDDRLRGLRRAAAGLEGLGSPLRAARVLCDLAGAARQQGERSEAREAAARAHEHAERAGTVRVARIARQELRALGVRAQATSGLGVAALTPAERRVADLAADGRTNRQIAQALFVSEKTVETHLARAFRKLDIGSRRQLPGALT